jgi:hypothetical protein
MSQGSSRAEREREQTDRYTTGMALIAGGEQRLEGAGVGPLQARFVRRLNAQSFRFGMWSHHISDGARGGRICLRDLSSGDVVGAYVHAFPYAVEGSTKFAPTSAQGRRVRHTGRGLLLFRSGAGRTWRRRQGRHDHRGYANDQSSGSRT